MNTDKKKKIDFSKLSDKKAADKKSVFDSDFIGRQGGLNPRTIKEISMTFGLCAVLAIVFFFNFHQSKIGAQTEDDLALADLSVLEAIEFDAAWDAPEKIQEAKENPMLDLNKLLEYQRKNPDEVEQAEPEEPKQPRTELKRVMVSVKGILWKPDGQSTALIDREMLKENQQYKGYTIAKVMKQAVILADSDGNHFTLDVGEDKEIIVTQTIENE